MSEEIRSGDWGSTDLDRHSPTPSAEQEVEDVLTELLHEATTGPAITTASESAARLVVRHWLTVYAALVKEGEQLTPREVKLAATAIADVWVIQADDEPEPHEATLLHRKLCLASGETDG